MAEAIYTEEQRRRSPESLVLGFSMFVMGGCGLAYEYTFSKIAGDLLGNSARQWAIIIGVMLFFMGIGADLQKYLKPRALVDKLIVSEVALGLIGGFGPLLSLFVFGLSPSHYALIQYVLISAVGLLIGFEIPLITRINEQYMRDISINLARILKMDYIGALCGALFWIFVLPKFFNMVETAFVLGMLTLFVAAIGIYTFRAILCHPKVLIALVLLGEIALGVGLVKGRDWSSHAEQFLFRDRIVFSATTPYQHIVLTRSATGEIACFINGHLQFFSADEHIYHENLVHPAMAIAPSRERVLILGGGDGLALREVLKWDDVEEITLVDLDPAMTDMARDNPLLAELNKASLSDSRVKRLRNGALVETEKRGLVIPSIRRPRQGGETVAEINVINLDAYNYASQAQGLFHVIILDFPDPNAPALAKLYSKQFYELVARKLADGGVMVQQSSSPHYAKEAYLAIGRTMGAAGFKPIPYHDNVPSFGEWGWWITGDPARWSQERLRDALGAVDADTLPEELGYLTPELIHASLAFGKEQLQSDETAVTTITQPVVAEYYLKAWENSL